MATQLNHLNWGDGVTLTISVAVICIFNFPYEQLPSQIGCLKWYSPSLRLSFSAYAYHVLLPSWMLETWPIYTGNRTYMLCNLPFTKIHQKTSSAKVLRYFTSWRGSILTTLPMTMLHLNLQPMDPSGFYTAGFDTVFFLKFNSSQSEKRQFTPPPPRSKKKKASFPTGVSILPTQTMQY